MYQFWRGFPVRSNRFLCSIFGKFVVFHVPTVTKFPTPRSIEGRENDKHFSHESFSNESWCCCGGFIAIFIYSQRDAYRFMVKLLLEYGFAYEKTCCIPRRAYRLFCANGSLFGAERVFRGVPTKSYTCPIAQRTNVFWIRSFTRPAEPENDHLFVYHRMDAATRNARYQSNFSVYLNVTFCNYFFMWRPALRLLLVRKTNGFTANSDGGEIGRRICGRDDFFSSQCTVVFDVPRSGGKTLKMEFDSCRWEIN